MMRERLRRLNVSAGSFFFECRNALFPAALVDKGIYGLTRNPMYLGNLALYTAAQRVEARA